MASLRKHTHASRGPPDPPPVTTAPDSPSLVKKIREARRANVLSAAIAEHYNRTNPIDHHDVPQLRDIGDFGDRGSDVPWWVKHPLFKGLVVTGLIMGALSPVFLKVGRADSEQRRKREHNDSFKKSNPEVASLGLYQQNNYYCHAPFPGALDSVAYKPPHGSELLAIQIVTRNGDRAPCGVLPFENDVTWNCDGPDLYDPSGMPIEVTRTRDEPHSLKTNIWEGNCWRCDSTGRGIAQQHMLGEALGNIYGGLLEMSPANLYVRSVDSEAIVRGVTGMIRGLMTNAIDAGPVRIETGLNREEDILLPRPSACPRLGEILFSARSGPDWESFKEKRQSVMQELAGIMSNRPLRTGNGESSSTSGSGGGTGRAAAGAGEGSGPLYGSQRGQTEEEEEGEEEVWGVEWEAAEAGSNGGLPRGRITGERLPEQWEARFDLFLDTVRTRTCNGMALPCSPRTPGQCVSEDQAKALFEAGDWSFHRKYTHKREETAGLYAGPLLALLLKNLGALADEHDPTPEYPSEKAKGTVQVYSGEVDTVGGILAALNVTDWAWPPYASNIVLELWQRTESEALPRMEGGQIESERFVRMLYNGRVVKPNFCQRDECPLRTYKSHVMQFLVPENLEAACKAQLHPNDPHSPPDPNLRPPPPGPAPVGVTDEAGSGQIGALPPPLAPPPHHRR
ncbi:unnamed protein product [Scytosiphon promiscuus]